MSIEVSLGSGKSLVRRAILDVVMEGGYRGDLEAAQARIAQLEEELREARDFTSPALAEAEARHAALVARGNTGAGFVALLPAFMAVLLTIPVFGIAITYGDFTGGGIFAGVTLSIAVGLAWLLRSLTRKQRTTAIQLSANKLEEARRLARLEAQVRELKKEEPHVRVAAAEAPPAEEDIERLQGPAHERRS